MSKCEQPCKWNAATGGRFRCENCLTIISIEEAAEMLNGATPVSDDSSEKVADLEKQVATLTEERDNLAADLVTLNEENEELKKGNAGSSDTPNED